MDFVDERAVDKSHGWLVDHEGPMADAKTDKLKTDEYRKKVFSAMELVSKRKTATERAAEARCSPEYDDACKKHYAAVREEEHLYLQAKNHSLLISVWQTLLKLTRM